MTLLIIILIIVAVAVGVWYISRRRPAERNFGGQAKPKSLPMVQPVQGLKTLSGSERQKPPIPPKPFEAPKPPMPKPTPPAPAPPMPRPIPPTPPMPPTPPVPPFPPSSNPPKQF